MARERRFVVPIFRVTGVVALPLLASFLAMMPGCGGGPENVAPPTGLHAVKGKVKSEVGSVTGLTINFHPVSKEARMSSGEVKSDGSFELKTLLPGDGASDGDYKVYFTKVLGGKKSGAIPAKYQSAEETDLAATIKPETSDLGTITLKK